MSISGLESFAPCLQCDTNIQFCPQLFYDYFETSKGFCTCDFFTSLKGIVEVNFMRTNAYSIIGAKHIIFHILLEKNKEFKLNLLDYNIPESAEILHINYCPQDPGLFPLQTHGNEIHTLSPIQKDIVIYPKITNDDSATAKITIGVSWIDIKGTDELIEFLFIALNHYMRHNYSHCIIPLNIVVESKPVYLTSQYLKKFFNRYSNLKYDDCINTILPMIVSHQNISPLNKNVIDDLNALRKLRNKIAHEGKPMSELSHKKVASFITSCVIAYYYSIYICKKLDLS